MITHFIPIDFNHNSICGLPKTEWVGGTNNWDWVTCLVCLDHRPVAEEGLPAHLPDALSLKQDIIIM